MITKITGSLTSVAEGSATLSLGALEYEVLIPDFARRQLQARLGETITLHTLHYLEGNPAQGKLIPRLVGFLNEVEREFFEMFCSVNGVGVRKALRAMVRPVQDVAALIEEQNAKGLSTLPGVGPSTAERIIAKLRRKMSKFALIVARDAPYEASVERNVVEETFHVLCSLGHSEADAHALLNSALSAEKKFQDVESLLHAVYQQSHRADE